MAATDTSEIKLPTSCSSTQAVKQVLIFAAYRSRRATYCRSATPRMMKNSTRKLL